MRKQIHKERMKIKKKMMSSVLTKMTLMKCCISSMRRVLRLMTSY